MTSTIKLDFLTTKEALEVNRKARELGYPPENKILIAVPDAEQTTKGGLFIPSSAEESIPKKGVLILPGVMDEDNQRFKDLEIGQVLTFGLYAGKEFDFNFEDHNNPITPKGYKLTILSVNEILFIEYNK